MKSKTDKKYKSKSQFYISSFLCWYVTLPTPYISEKCIKIKINVNFYSQVSLWCLIGLHKTFLGTTAKCENKN